MISKVNRSEAAFIGSKFYLHAHSNRFFRVDFCINDYDKIRFLLSNKRLKVAGEMMETRQYEVMATECEIWDNRIIGIISNKLHEEVRLIIYQL